MKKLFALLSLTLLASGCSSAPPNGSASRDTYDSCIAQADFIEKAGGSKARSAASEYREYCTCTSKIYWELEKENGQSFIFGAIDNPKLDAEVFEKCATDEMRKKREEKIAKAKKREEDIINYITNLDSMYK